MELRIIKHGSEDYKEMIDLRMKILRTPLGLSFTKEQLSEEKNDVLIGAYAEDKLIGCCVLTRKNEKEIQLRQMAVNDDAQHKGIGKVILEFAEKYALAAGYKVLMMHARDVAVPFYEKCGYIKKGDPFIEVTIPHFHMEKKLSPAHMA